MNLLVCRFVYQYSLVYHGGWQHGRKKKEGGREKNERREKGRNVEKKRKERRISDSFTLLSWLCISENYISQAPLLFWVG